MARWALVLQLGMGVLGCTEDPLDTNRGPGAPVGAGQPDTGVAIPSVDGGGGGSVGSGAMDSGGSVAPTADSAAGPQRDGSTPMASSDAGGGQTGGAQPDAGAVQGDAGASPGGGEGGVVSPGGPQLAISADFLNQTLSIFDVDKLKQGAKRADVLVGSVDLSMYSPGPLALGVTPDGKTVLVSISAGFLGAFIDVPAGDGTLLFVDIATRKVVGELKTGKSPMGIVISPDGKRAFVGQFSETYFAVVDIEKRTFEKVSTGSSYNEELSLDDTGSVGILTYGPAGNAKTFSIANPRTNGQTSGLDSDAAGVAFFPGTKIAYLLQAPTALTLNVGGHDLVDVTDPTRPRASDHIRVSSAPSMYPVTAVHARNSVAYPETKDNVLTLVEMKLEGGAAKRAQAIKVGSAASLAYGVAEVPDGRVLLAVPGEHYVGVVDLATQQAFTVPWEVTKSGPNDIKMIPRR